MVRQALLSKEALFDLAARERDSALGEHFHLSPTELSRIRSKRVGEAVYEAAKRLAENGFHTQITIHNLAAIVYDEWDTPEQYKSYVASALRRRYENAQRRTEIYYDLSPPYVHFLREEVGAYRGNLLAVRARYPEFAPSNADYLRGVRLPASFGFAEARLLGAYVIDGTYHTQEGSRSVLGLEGGQSDGEWYETVRDEIAAVHGLDVDVFTSDEVFENESGGRYQLSRPRIKLHSQAVTTWLQDDIGLASVGGQKRLPSLSEFGETRAQRAGLLAGALAGMGRIHKGSRYETRRTERRLLDDVRALAEGLGFCPVLRDGTTSDGTPVRKLIFNADDVRSFDEQGLLWNPRHRRVFEN